MKRWAKETREVLAVLALGAGTALGPFAPSSDGAAWRPQQHDVLASPQGATQAAAIPRGVARSARESLGICLQAQPAPTPAGDALVEAGTGTAVDGRNASPFPICDGWGDPRGTLHADANGRPDLRIRSLQGVRYSARVMS